MCAACWNDLSPFSPLICITKTKSSAQRPPQTHTSVCMQIAAPLFFRAKIHKTLNDKTLSSEAYSQGASYMQIRHENFTPLFFGSINFANLGSDKTARSEKVFNFLSLLKFLINFFKVFFAKNVQTFLHAKLPLLLSRIWYNRKTA